MSLTIDELIIAASVDPRGIKRGLDQGSAHLRDFGRSAVQELDKLPGAAAQNGVYVAQRLAASANEEFRRQAAGLRSSLLQGLLNESEFKARMAQLAQGFNTTLGASARFVSNEFKMSAERTLLATEELTGQMKREGLKAGEQYAAGLGDGISRSAYRVTIAGRDVTQRLSSIAVGAAFAFEMMEEGGARGEGAMRRVLRSVGILALSFGPEGALVAAAALGLTAVMDYFNRTEKEAKKATDRIREHIASAANAGRADDLRAQARETFFGQPYAAGATTPTAVSSLDPRAFKGSLADLRAQLGLLGTELANAPNRFASRMIQNQIDVLKKQLDPLEALYRQINAAADALQSQEAENVGKITGMSVTALSPNAKEKEQQPYAALRAALGELTTAYEGMRTLGLSPTLALQTQLENAFTRTGAMLDALRDKTGPAANALRAILSDLRNAGIHERDALLPGGGALSLGLPSGQEDRVAASLIARVRDIRESTGEFSDATRGAEASLLHLLDAVSQRIETEGGLLRASNTLLKARGEIARELAAQSKGEGKGFFSQEELEAINISVRDNIKGVTAALRDNVDQWASMREAIQGVLDAASGIGSISTGLRDVTSGLLHAVDIARQVRALTAPAKDGKPAGEGLASLSGLATGVGAVGAAISIGAGIASMLSSAFGNSAAEQARAQLESDLRAAIKENSIKLAENTLALAAGGISESVNLLADVRELVQEFSGAGAEGQGRFNSLDSIISAAKKSGFSITDTSGQIQLDPLKQFLEYLTTTTNALRTFGNSLGDQQSLASLRALVYGKGSAADSIGSTVAILRQFAPKLAADFDGLDATTQEGRDKIKTALQSLFEALASGAITAEDFGRLNGAKDLASIIQSLATGLDSMNTAVNNVTGSLSNVPTWYKVNLARWQAAAPDDGGGSASGALARISPATTMVGGSGSGGAGVSARSLTQSTMAPVLNFNGDVLVDARALSADELFAAVLRAAQRSAQAQFGDTTLWSQVQVPSQ